MLGAMDKRVDLARVAANLTAIRGETGRFVYSVLKANAYGCGAVEVARAIADLTDGFYVFDLAEAVAAGLGAYGKPVIAVDQVSKGYSAADYRSARVRPIVASVERAAALKSCDPVVSLDTGMRRFACREEELQKVVRAGGITEAMTHAVRMDQVEMLKRVCGGMRLHAAATALLGEKEAWLDATRPGLALYRGALRVSARVVEAADVRPGERAGYRQFDPSPAGDDSGGRIGVILAGYSNGYRAGVCRVRGENRRVFEVGMQSALIELRPGEGVGEEVLLLGDGLSESDVAKAWGTSGQEVLTRLGFGS
jgi:alanine racemase